jgi:hypothetical protein
MSKLSKPTLTNPKAEAALAFAEGGTNKDSGKRAFFAPEGYRRLTVNLPEALHKKLRLAAIEQDCTATEIIERLLTKELGSK